MSHGQTGAIHQAVTLHQQGQFGEAERLYNVVLQAEPGHFDALHLLGVLMHQRGKSVEALALIAKALETNARSADAHANFGRVLAALRRPEDAVAAYDKALALKSDHLEALFHRGNALVGLARAAEAVASYDAALALKPTYAQAHINRGVALRGLRRPAEALDSYDRALAINPNAAEAHANRGNALLDLKRSTEALESYDRALAIHPANVDALYNRGNALMALRRPAEALAGYDAALALAPGHVNALVNRGAALRELQRPEESLASYDRALALSTDHLDALRGRGNMLRELRQAAEAIGSYDRALAVDPRQAEVLNNRGNALSDLNRPADALASFDEALAVRPDYPEALINRGNVLMDLRRADDALASYDRVLALDPGHAEAHWNKSLIWLATGDLARGFGAYEWRAKKNDDNDVRQFAQPRWTGAEPLAGKTILLHAEQGFGDTIQFIRYAPLVAAKGARVIVEAPNALKPLVAGVKGVSAVVSRDDTMPAFDWHCPLMSLPLAFGTTLDTVPADVPYLKAPADRIETWRDRLPAGALRVGIVWSGNPTHKNDRNRSIALDRIAALSSDSRVQFIGIQRDVRGDDMKALQGHPHVTALGASLEDFADTAAVVSLLDLVISVDTSVAHLAGALGKPVWIMLPYNGDWRWMLEGETSPWYPTARLFRQPAIGDWDSVLAQVRQKLVHATDVVAQKP